MAESTSSTPRQRQSGTDALGIWKEQLGKFGVPPAGEDWEKSADYLVCRAYRTDRGTRLELRLYRDAEEKGFVLFANMVVGEHAYEDLRLLAESLHGAGLDISGIGVQGVYKETNDMLTNVEAYAKGYKQRLLAAGQS